MMEKDKLSYCADMFHALGEMLNGVDPPEIRSHLRYAEALCRLELENIFRNERRKQSLQHTAP